MQRWRLYLAALATSVLLPGCINVDLQITSLQPPVPELQVARKYPLRVALLLPRATLDLNRMEPQPTICEGGSVAEYAFGWTFRDLLVTTFSQLFDYVEVIDGSSSADTFDLVLEANLSTLRYKLSCAGEPAAFFLAAGEVKLFDSRFRTVWSGFHGSVKEEIHRTASGYDRVETDIGTLLSRLAKSYAQALTASPQFAAFLQNLDRPASAYTAAPERAPATPAPIRSDIDTLPAVKPHPQHNAYAVVIGIEHYRQQLPAADFAVHDAETVTKYLTAVLGYPEENVVTLTNDRASYVDIAKYIEQWLPNNVEPGGTVFVYYSGHGAPNPRTGDAFLLPYDGDPAFLDQTGYSLQRLYAALGKLPAKEVVVALDSCFSGSGGRSVIAKGARAITLNLKATPLPGRNLTVLTASSGEQMSSTYDEKGHGLFTYFLLKGIKNEDVVASDGSLRLDDLFAYLEPQVERVARKQFNNEQTPQLIGATGN